MSKPRAPSASRRSALPNHDRADRSVLRPEARLARCPHGLRLRWKPTVIDKSKRDDGTFSREDFIYDAERDCYVCPAGVPLRHKRGPLHLPGRRVAVFVSYKRGTDGMRLSRYATRAFTSCAIRNCEPSEPARSAGSPGRLRRVRYHDRWRISTYGLSACSPGPS